MGRKHKHIISLGAGVQSSTMALMASRGLITPEPIAAIFADTGGEPPEVYAWLEWLKKELTIPVHRVEYGVLEDDDTVVRRSKKSGNLYRKSLIPWFTLDDRGKKGMLPRKCTRDYKIYPVFRLTKELAGVPRRNREGVYVQQWIGISTDEAHRMTVSKETWSKNRYPLIELEMSRADCLSWMEEQGYPRPPRSACYYCPFHSDYEWKKLKDEEPELFHRAVLFERRVQRAAKRDEVSNGVPYFHASRVPLSKVEFKDDDTHDGFGNECEGMCGV